MFVQTRCDVIVSMCVSWRINFIVNLSKWQVSVKLPSPGTPIVCQSFHKWDLFLFCMLANIPVSHLSLHLLPLLTSSIIFFRSYAAIYIFHHNFFSEYLQFLQFSWKHPPHFTLQKFLLSSGFSPERISKLSGEIFQKESQKYFLLSLHIPRF